MSISFKIIKTDKKARRGKVTTAHGSFETPAFMATATAATVKAMSVDMVKETGAEIAICNTYHLMLRPTAERVAKLGGLHKFMNWNKTIVTDSGGFQVMSLSKLRDLDENGVVFRSHIDGSKHELTPERSMEIQNLLDSNITMALDECTPHPASHEVAKESMQRSMRWAKRCKDSFEKRDGYGLFGIQQGSTYEDLREESAKSLIDIEFDGYAIGGLAVGEGQETMFNVLDYAPDMLPKDKPRYLMGVGTPSDIIGAVKRGVDMFDCVMPTRAGRTGRGYTYRGTINMKNARHKDDQRPIDDRCTCPTCKNYSRAYVHHLLRIEEILGAMLLTQHNLHYYQTLMNGIRISIENSSFDKFVDIFHKEQIRWLFY